MLRIFLILLAIAILLKLPVTQQYVRTAYDKIEASVKKVFAIDSKVGSSTKRSSLYNNPPKSLAAPVSTPNTASNYKPTQNFTTNYKGSYQKPHTSQMTSPRY